MAIYTHSGDDGQTTGAAGRRMSKAAPLCHALGALDELSAHVGAAVAACRIAELREVLDALAPVQPELLVLGVYVQSAADQLRPSMPPPADAPQRMEQQIDSVFARVGAPKEFILPGGTPAACALHVARTACRRAERWVAALVDEHVPVTPEVLRYLNRLGDLLFALALLANHAAGQAERTWDA